MHRVVSMLGLAAILLTFAGHARAQESVGIPVCDEYLTGYERCIRSHTPADQREGMLKLLETMRKQWIETAKNADFKPMIEKTCESNLKQMRRAMKQIGCTM